MAANHIPHGLRQPECLTFAPHHVTFALRAHSPKGDGLPNHIVTLTTDFGASDHYVGAIKGVILKLNPEATIIDISNSVNSYDILDGALTIAQVYNYYPSDTIHMVIVDPGVGTARRPLLVTTEKHHFIAP